MSFYQLYELNHAALAPWRAVADATRLAFQNPLNPFADTPFGRSVAAAAELFERTTRRYGKPEFGIDRDRRSTASGAGRRAGRLAKAVLLAAAFQAATCRRAAPPIRRLLIVAPLSGHYATLLRGTVEAMLPDHEVFITDWQDARMVPLVGGPLRPRRLHRLRHRDAPPSRAGHARDGGLPALRAGARRGRADVGGPRPDLPATMTLMGGPIDTRLAPTAVNQLAEARGTDWFRRNTIMTVPFPHPGFMRDVYPGFLQLSGFMAMNFDRHVTRASGVLPATSSTATAIRPRSTASSTTSISRSWT